MKKIIFKTTTILCFSLFSLCIKGQNFGTENLKSYSEVKYFLDCRYEIENTFLSTPFNSVNINSKIQNAFKSNNIKFSQEFDKNLYPMLNIIVFYPIIASSLKSYQIDFRIYDIINGKKVITYYNSYDYSRVNSGNDSDAKELWGYLDKLLLEFINDWRTMH